RGASFPCGAISSRKRTTVRDNEKNSITSSPKWRATSWSCCNSGLSSRGGVRKFIHKALVRGRARRGVAMAEEHVIQEKALRRFCEQVLAKLGVPAEDARVTTDVLVLAHLRGIDSHGVARLG